MRTQNDNWYKAMAMSSQNNYGLFGSDKFYPSNYCSKKYLFSSSEPWSFLHSCQFCWLSMEKYILPSPWQTPSHTAVTSTCVFLCPFLLGTPDKHPRKVELHPLFFFMPKKEGRQKAPVHLPYPFRQCRIIKDSGRSNLWDQRFMSAHSPRTVLCDPIVKAAKAWRCPSHPTIVQNQRLVLMAFSF